MTGEALDKLAIAETLQAYALACDTRDFAALRAIFTEDARARYDADPWLSGGSAIVDWIEFATTGVIYSQHAIVPVRITVDGDAATAIGYLTSHQRRAEAPDQVAVMTSRYDWTLHRTGDGWRISELVLRVGWFEERSFPQPAGGIRTVQDDG